MRNKDFPHKTQDTSIPVVTLTSLSPQAREMLLKSSCISSSPGIQEIGELIGLNSEVFEKALCSRTMEAAKEKVVSSLNIIQVRGPRRWSDLECAW